MKRNRSQALGFVLDHRKKIVKGLNALLQILGKLPDDVSVADMVAAGKAASKKGRPTKSKGKAKKAKSKSSSKSKAVVQSAAASDPAAVAQPSVDAALM